MLNQIFDIPLPILKCWLLCVDSEIESVVFIAKSAGLCLVKVLFQDNLLFSYIKISPISLQIQPRDECLNENQAGEF